MSALLRNGGFASDDQRKAMFARMRGGGGGSSRSGASRSWSAETEMDSVLESIRKANEGRSTLDKMIFGMEGVTMGTPPIGGIGKIGKAGKALYTSIASGALGQGIGKFRDRYPTINPRLDHYLAMAQDAANTVSVLAGLASAKRAVGGTKAGIRSGEWLKTQGEKLSELGKAVAGKIPAPIATPLSWLYKAYNTVAQFTGAEMTALKKVPGSFRRLQFAKTELPERAARLRTQAGEIRKLSTALEGSGKDTATDILGVSHKKSLAGARSARDTYEEGVRKYFSTEAGAEGSVLSAANLDAQAARVMEKAGKMKADAINSLARATYVVAGGAAVHTVEQARKESYRRDMEKVFAQNQDYVLPADPGIEGLSGKQAAMFAVGTLGNPVEKQTRDYFSGAWTKDLAERAYQELSYDKIEAARKAGTISEERAQKLQIERAKNKPRNMAGKSLYTVTPAVAGFTKMAARQVSKAVQYGDASEAGKIFNPQYATGTGLLAYGNTVGSKLPSGIPVTWNAILAAQGVAQAVSKGPKQKRAKKYRPVVVP